MIRTGLLVALLSLLGTAQAKNDAPRGTAGVFDYYVLSLSWSPEYCATTRRDDEPQCARPYAFVAHGLWPQNERGWPADCTSRERVSDATIQRLLPIMPSKGLIIHEWRKHGTCSGLGADAYFAALERSYRAIRIPERFRLLSETLSVPASDLRRDLLAANPSITAEGLVLQCSGRYLQEVRICLDRRFAPRACGADLRNRCGDRVALRPVR
ncbi:ribonuclease T2 [Nevskia sp.]|uniref:ribonuclease T2 n=1 Tax=Nevskia sp. TaxID=1929292 RepID=UPI0025ED1B08|nr:ribonuclease T2 [Nevskia sp.]